MDMFQEGFGPHYTEFIVEAEEAESAVRVTLDLKQLLEQMIPEGLASIEVPEGQEQQWEHWLEGLETSHMWYEGGCEIWHYHFNLWDILGSLSGFLEEDTFETVFERLQMGEFSIAVTVTDWSGNEASGVIELTVVDVMRPLEEGWNIVSTGVTLDGSYNTWGAIYNLGDGLSCDEALRYDPASQDWVVVSEDYEIKPLEAIYVHATGKDQIGFIFEREATPPPMRDLKAGWNLIGSPNSKEMPVEQALKSIELATGNFTGYTMVISPRQDINYGEEYCYVTEAVRECCFGGYGWGFHQEPWVYVIDSLEDRWMTPDGGHWVFLVNDATLAGATLTPITYLDWPS